MFDRKKALIFSVMTVLMVSALAGAFSLAPAPAAAAPASSSDANWPYINGNIGATNWFNQTQLSAANAGSMQVSWVVPFPNVDLTWKQAPGAKWSVEPGSSAPPLLVNGIVYVVTDQGTVYAMNAKDGSVLWSNSVTLNYTAALKTVPIFETQVAKGVLHGCTSGEYNTTCIFATSSPVMHRHGINYIDGVIHVTGFACELWGFNATSGAVAYHITNICVNVPGNPYGAYPATYTSDPPMIWNGPNGPILAYVMGAYTNSGGRTFLVGYDYNAVLKAGAKGFDGACAVNGGTYSTGTVEGTCQAETAGQGPLWQVFMNPPNGGDANWDNELCSIGSVFDYPAWRANGTMGRPCTSLPQSVLMNDWGIPKGIDATVSTSWGQYVIDNKTGIIYFGTGEEDPYPYYDPTVRPGLNLYGSSIVAVNMTSGKMVWWYQMAPHDVSDWDASWAPLLGTAQGQPAVFKATKLGVLFAFNRLTGKPIWVMENPADVYGKCTFSGTVSHMTTWANGNPIGATPSMSTAYGKGADTSCMSLGSPLNENWLEHPYPTWPDINGTWVTLPYLTGALESDVTYDGHYIFGAWMNQGGSTIQMNPKTETAPFTGKPINNPINVTLTALDANTGKIVWTHTFNNLLFRGGMTVTNGMLIMPGGDGDIHFLNTTNGNEITKLHVGAPLYVQPVLGQTSDGQLRMLSIFGGGRWGAGGSLGGVTVPGGVMAWSIPVGGAGGVSTTTVISTSTAGASGIDPTTFYVVAGIAVIAIVAAGALAVSRRKPAS